jgi:hypothetical protein
MEKKEKISSLFQVPRHTFWEGRQKTHSYEISILTFHLPIEKKIFSIRHILWTVIAQSVELLTVDRIFVTRRDISS